MSPEERIRLILLLEKMAAAPETAERLIQKEPCAAHAA